MTHDSHRVVIGCHQSRLAQAEARWVGRELRRIRPHVKLEYVEIPRASTRAAATREIEDALLAGSIDIAVCSAKDLPFDWRPGSALAAVPTREMPFDVLVAEEGTGFEDLPRGARVGAPGLHRRAQILSHRPDLNVVDVPCDLETCVPEVGNSGFSAFVVSGAEMERLELADRVSEIIMSTICLPAPGQGAVALRVREKDARTRDVAALLDDPVARATVEAECACLRALGRGFELPFAAYCEARGDELALEGLIVSVDGRRIVRDSEEGSIEDAAMIGAALGKRLLSDGGDAILRGVGSAVRAGG